MRLMANLLGAAAVLLFIVSATAQTKPDFSGRWTSEPEPAATSPGGVGQAGTAREGEGRRSGGGRRVRIGDMGSGWGSTITITQDAGRLTVEYAFFARGDMQPPLKFVYALDGSETKNSVMMGRGIQVQMSRTAWEGDKLVITTAHNFENPSDGQPMKVEVKQTLSLESPTSLIVETTRSGVLGGPSSTTRTVYRKF
ncbi:MAG: hypothetical protein L0229_10050 [Blastocatellia bacterium]|nr:hypothetical protein [Blastocatellia bacterium]